MFYRILRTKAKNAVVSLAVLVKGLSDDATDNIGMCKSLGDRVDLILRLVEQLPHPEKLDDKLVATLFETLKGCRSLLADYGKKGKMTRFFQSSGLKKKFTDLDTLLGQCVDDLTLSVGIHSSSKIEELGVLVTSTMRSLLATEGGETDASEGKEDLSTAFLLDYNDIQFILKRGIRREVGLSSLEARCYLASLHGEEVAVLEPSFDVTAEIIEQWKARVVLLGVLMRTANALPTCLAHGYGGGVYDDEDEGSVGPMVQGLFLVMKHYSSSLLDYIISPDWKTADTERTIEFGCRIACAAHVMRAQLLQHCYPGPALLPVPLRAENIFMLDNTYPVVSYAHMFQHCQLVGGRGEGPLHFEIMPLQTLRWCAPEQLKTDHRSSSAGEGCDEREREAVQARDVYTMGLLLCHMLTGALPYSDLLLGVDSGDPNSATALLLDALRSNSYPPYHFTSPRLAYLHPSLIHLLTLCLNPNPRSRPTLLFFLQSLQAISLEMKMQLPFDVQDFGIGVGGSDSSGFRGEGDDDRDSDGDSGGLGDFDAMTSQVESASSALRVFLPSEPCTKNLGGRAPAVVVFGSKVVLLDFKTSEKECESFLLEGEDEDEEEALSDFVGMKENTSGIASKERGVVIFHIDNTTSMRRQDRNLLTKEVLLRVIPDLLRKNFRVIVNSWASDVVTKGKIQTREIRVSANALEPDKKEELRQDIQNIIFEILNPSGKTDLYGSIYQLLTQCDDLEGSGGVKNHVRTSGPIYCFVLTDGNHNHFAYPTHTPSCVGEDYFGVYSGQLVGGKLKFGLSGNAGHIPTAEAFLASKFLSVPVTSSCPGTRGGSEIFLTLIGIGDASTAPLSSLAAVLGDRCSFVGITEVGQADSVFKSVDNCSSSSGQLRITFSGDGEGVVEDLQYVVGEEDSVWVSGCVTIADPARSEAVVNRTHFAAASNGEVDITFAQEFLDLSAEAKSGQSSLEDVVHAVLPVLGQIRCSSYDVTAETFQPLFTQLLQDKKQLWQVKTTLFAKKTRHFRHSPIIRALMVWLKELENLVDSQISAYRLNVEVELLTRLETDLTGQASTGCVQPASIVLERLKNNLKNAGKKVHQVHRHVSAIRNIRDRTLNLGTMLLSSDLSLAEEKNSTGVVLSVRKRSGKHYNIVWEVDNGGGGSISNLKQCLQTADITNLDLTLSKEYAEMTSPMQVSYPCLLVRASFDPLTVIRAAELFTLRDVCEGASGEALRFCAEEVWDLCASSSHVVGDELPVSHAVRQVEMRTEDCKEATSYNMILPLANTPLLMALYCERGRLYHNGINITGDHLALTPATAQWAKAFHDALFFLCNPTLRAATAERKQQTLAAVALQCVVSYSYAIDCSVLAPGRDTVELLFPAAAAAAAAAAAENASSVQDDPVTVIKRDVMSGLTCPVGVAIVVCEFPAHATAGRTVTAWNTLLVTMFSRLCEAISGHKNIRNREGADPSVLETPYRVLVGELQTSLKRRLHVEWSSSSTAEKLAVIASNSALVKECLCKIVTLFLNKLDEYNLPTFASVGHMLALAVAVRNYGIGHLRDAYLQCKESTSDLSRVLLGVELDDSFTLPLFYQEVADGSCVQLREAGPEDHTALLAYIDAIVATKVFPKIIYKPVENPSYPSFSASDNQSLHFDKAKIDWDVNLPVANISFIGNVNSGKSSIGGQLLTCLNIVPKRVLGTLQRAASQLGRTEDLRFAWVMDSLREERAGGFTVTPKFTGFQTSTRRFTMIDNPGHNDYAGNYATGIYHADIVLLVMSAVASEQQLAEVARSMAEEHLLTAFCFGVRQVIVLINKMDSVGYSEKAFKDSRDKAFRHLKKAGFRVNGETVCLPMSALEGKGFLSIPPELDWYEGPCFLQALDEAALPQRHAEKQFRMTVDQVLRVGGVGEVLCGKVERGTLSVHDEVSIYPSGAEGVTVKSIESHGNSVSLAKPGDDVGLALSQPKASKKSRLFPKYRRGMIIALSAHAAVPVMKRFEVQLFITGNMTLKVGAAPTILTHLCAMQVTVKRLCEVLGKNNQVLRRSPDSVTTGETCVLELEAREGVAAETIHHCPKLSRFVVQSNRMTAAIGFIRAQIS